MRCVVVEVEIIAIAAEATGSDGCFGRFKGPFIEVRHHGVDLHIVLFPDLVYFLMLGRQLFCFGNLFSLHVTADPSFFAMPYLIREFPNACSTNLLGGSLYHFFSERFPDLNGSEMSPWDYFGLISCIYICDV